MSEEAYDDPKANAIWLEMCGPNNYPEGAFVWINACNTPEEHFLPYVQQLRALNVDVSIDMFEPRELDFDGDDEFEEDESATEPQVAA